MRCESLIRRRLVSHGLCLLAVASWALADEPTPEQLAEEQGRNRVQVLTGSQRTPEAIDQIYAVMPPVRHTPPEDRWRHLPRTARKLRERGPFNLVMLGDSIINDTSRSSFEHLLNREYEGLDLRKITLVRGSTGCWFYRQADRVGRYLLPWQPDLVVIGGISQRDDCESIEAVIDQVRAGRPTCEFLLLSPTFGRIDPNDPESWNASIDLAGNDYRARLARLAVDQRCAFLDMTSAWGQYIRSVHGERPLDSFKRDAVHANEQGEQILGRILAGFLSIAPAVSTVSQPELDL